MGNEKSAVQKSGIDVLTSVQWSESNYATRSLFNKNRGVFKMQLLSRHLSFISFHFPLSKSSIFISFKKLCRMDGQIDGSTF